MEHFVEVIMEWMFARFKGKPDSMPEIEEKETFVVRHNRLGIVVCILASLVIVAICALFWLLIKQEVRWMGVLIGVPMLFILFLTIGISCYRCTVTTESLRRSGFGWRKKEVLWADVICVRVIENTEQDSPSVTIAVYDHTRKCVIDADANMDNAWHIVKMAEKKGIEIRRESNLSLKQIKRLED